MIDRIRGCFKNLRFSARLIISASKKYFILNMILSVISALTPYIPIILWKEILNSLLEKPEHFKVNGIFVILIALTTGYIISLLLEKLMDMIRAFVNYKYQDEVGYYLDNYIVDKVSSVELAFYDSSTLNNNLKNVSSNLKRSTQSMVDTVFGFIYGVVKLVVSVAMICTLSYLMIPIIIIFIIPSIIQAKYSNKERYKFSKEHSVDERKTEYYKDLFFSKCRQEIKLYNSSSYFIGLYKKSWEKWKNGKLKLRIKSQFTWIVQFIFLTVIEFIAYIIALIRLTSKTIGVGDVTYYISVANNVRDSFVEVFYLMVNFFQSSNEVNDIKEFMEMKPAVEEGGTKKPTGKPRIEFKNVSFKYPNAENNVLTNCSFILETGKSLGLVGANGAGKSTIVKLLCRFYDPTEGEILIDGVNAREYDITALRKLFCVLFQDYVLYSFSLRENVALSDMADVKNTNRVLDACEKSRVKDFISEWDSGIDTELTRRFYGHGKELSGGQWQRVSLARAFFRNSPIVLLDEPSAALDPLAENEIFEDFINVAKGRSVLLISHRLSNITMCDKIIVLDGGKIIEQGSHFDLLKQNGKYAHLFNLQAEKYK